MECLEVQKKLYAYVDAALPPESAGKVRSHLADCGVCSREARLLEQLTANLQHLPEACMSKSLRQRIIKAFRSIRKEILSLHCCEVPFSFRGLTCGMAAVGFLVGLLLGGSMLSAADIFGQENLLLVADMEGIFYEKLR